VLSGLNKVFDRNFIVGFVIPAMAFLGAMAFALDVFCVRPGWLTIKEPLKDTTVAVLLVLVLALLLLVLNRTIVRFLEGYWYVNLANSFDLRMRKLQKRCGPRLGNWLVGLQKRFQPKMRKKWMDLTERIKVLNQNHQPNADCPERDELMQAFATEFPSTEDQVLPTAFGNTLRAFEDYPRVMYGFESIQGWGRLLTVVPKNYRELIDTSCADMYCWMNLWFLSIFAVILEPIFLVFTLYSNVANTCFFVRHGGVVATAFLFGLFASWQTRMAAQEWGEGVKSAFDVYMPDLLKKLGYVRPDSREEERYLWETLSAAFIYRMPTSLDDLHRYREAANAEEDDPGEGGEA
jgi:hypothetical protein